MSQEKKVTMHRYRSISVCTVIAVVATILEGGAIAGATAGYEALAGVSKPLFDTVQIKCDGSTKPLSRTTRGSAEFVLDDSTKSVSADVKLKATPDAFYTVSLALIHNGPCGGADYAAAHRVIKTNSEGDSNTKLSAVLKPGDHGAFVWLDTVTSRDKIFSATYNFINNK